MNASDYAAWYGAVIATIVLIFDMIRWLDEGPIISATTGYNKLIIGNIEEDKNTYSTINLSNNGTLPTTIESLCIITCNFWFQKYFNSCRKNYFIPTPNQNSPLPFKLEIGSTWRGIAIQTNEIQYAIENKRVYFFVKFSHNKRNWIYKVK